MSIISIVALTGLVAYLSALGVQYGVPRMVIGWIRPEPVITGRPDLRLVDPGRALPPAPSPLDGARLQLIPLQHEVDLPPSAA